jgi:hypothetical protein
MIGKTRVGFKYLFWGMVVGVIFAPRSGKETRSKLLDKLSHAASSLLGLI